MLLDHVRYDYMNKMLVKKMKIAEISLMILLILSTVLSGCASTGFYQQVTSGYIGCEPEDIQISNELAELNGTESWIAECRGKKYICSYDSSDNTDCNEISEK